MHTENLVINNSPKCKCIKHFSTASPHIQATILSDAFVIKTIYLRDDSRLMVSSQKSDSIFVSYFKGEKEKESLHTVFSSIDVIAHKDVI